MYSSPFAWACSMNGALVVVRPGAAVAMAIGSPREGANLVQDRKLAPKPLPPTGAGVGGGDGEPPKANRKAVVCRFSPEGDPGPDDRRRQVVGGWGPFRLGVAKQTHSPRLHGPQPPPPSQLRSASRSRNSSSACGLARAS